MNQKKGARLWAIQRFSGRPQFRARAASFLIIVSMFLGFLGPNSAMAKPVPEPKEAIKGLRDRALALSPEEIGLSSTSEYPRVWGMLMETGRADGLVTLLVLGDGTVSLYLGSGGGVIGAGEHTSVLSVSKTMLATAEQYWDQFIPTSMYPLPEVGQVRFYILTFSGILTTDADENILGSGKHELSKLFFAGQDVITEIRLISERKGL